MRFLACAAFLCFAVPAFGEELKADFRKGEFDEDFLRYVGSTPEEFLTPETGGLRLRYTPQKFAADPAGLAWLRFVRGNFVATARYQILQVDKPVSAWGVGPELYLMLDNPTRDGISFGRVLHPEFDSIFSFNIRAGNPRRTADSKGFPTDERSLEGGLRLAREGTTLIVSMAQGGNDFVEVHRTEIGNADVRMVRFAAVNGKSPNTRLDMRFLEFQLKGDQLARNGQFNDDAPAPNGNAAPPSQGGNRSMFVVIILLLALPLFIIVPIVLYLALRKAKGTPQPGTAKKRPA